MAECNIYKISQIVQERKTFVSKIGSKVIAAQYPDWCSCRPYKQVLGKLKYVPLQISRPTRTHRARAALVGYVHYVRAGFELLTF